MRRMIRPMIVAVLACVMLLTASAGCSTRDFLAGTASGLILNAFFHSTTCYRDGVPIPCSEVP